MIRKNFSWTMKGFLGIEFTALCSISTIVVGLIFVYMCQSWSVRNEYTQIIQEVDDIKTAFGQVSGYQDPTIAQNMIIIANSTIYANRLISLIEQQSIIDWLFEGGYGGCITLLHNTLLDMQNRSRTIQEILDAPQPQQHKQAQKDRLWI